MSQKYGFDRIIATQTFPLDSTTSSAIEDDPKQIIGKAVTLTGTGTEPEVGYGSTGNMIFGIVTSVEKEDNISDRFVVAVAWLGLFEDVDTTSDGSIAVINKGLAVNGSGAVITSSTLDNAMCLAVDGQKCIIAIH